MPTFENGLRLGDLPAADTLTGAELVAIEQDGNTVRTTLAALAQYIKVAETIVPVSESFRGAVARRTTDIDATYAFFVPFQTVDFDTDSFFDIGQPTRLTVPAGVSKVRLAAAAAFTAVSDAGSIFFQMQKNGSAVGIFQNIREGTTGFTSNAAEVASPVISVVEGDYFEVRVNASGLTPAQVLGGNTTFFSIEIVEFA